MGFQLVQKIGHKNRQFGLHDISFMVWTGYINVEKYRKVIISLKQWLKSVTKFPLSVQSCQSNLSLLILLSLPLNENRCILTSLIYLKRVVRRKANGRILRGILNQLLSFFFLFSSSPEPRNSSAHQIFHVAAMRCRFTTAPCFVVRDFIVKSFKNWFRFGSETLVVGDCLDCLVFYKEKILLIVVF